MSTTTITTTETNVKNVVAQLRALLTKGSIGASSAVELIARTMELVEGLGLADAAEKKAVALLAIQTVAAGEDGVCGTADDVIPAQVLAAIRLMTENNLIEMVIDTIVDACKGRFDINKAKPIFCGCFRVLLQVFGRGDRSSAPNRV